MPIDFEKDLFSIDTQNPGDGISALKKKYGNFFNLFADSDHFNRFTGFCVNGLNDLFHSLRIQISVPFIIDCEKLYADFSEKNKALTGCIQKLFILFSR